MKRADVVGVEGRRGRPRLIWVKIDLAGVGGKNEGKGWGEWRRW